MANWSLSYTVGVVVGAIHESPAKAVNRRTDFFGAAVNY